MKTLIVALNSKYIHSALAPWYLKAACGADCGEVFIAEHTVNENLDDVLASIYLQKPDVAAFSCYIWNITHVLKLTASLKKLLLETVIVLGGPEVSYDAGDILREHAFIDFVLAGEGEMSLPKLIRHIGTAHSIEAYSSIQADNSSVQADTSCGAVSGQADGMERIDGLAYRSDDGVIANAPALVEVLDSILSPYTEEMLLSLKNKIVYFETSRGCPFSCSYCLSSVSEGTRYFSMDRVLAELDRLIASGVKQIKFVDRTFNFNRKRALAIIQHIIGLDKRACNFHFEVGADLFDEEMLQLLENAPKGLFQLEAGVQTANEEALTAVNRKTNLEKLFENLVRLQKCGNIHVHSDLIAGLPYEDYNSFGNSFNKLYITRPHQLQLGFLKLLKGTRLRHSAANEGFEFNDFPPYEILKGKSISYDELIVLKGIAELVERYYNSARFVFSLEYMIAGYFESPFSFFESFCYFHKKNGYMEIHAGVRELYAIFESFASTYMNEGGRAALRELLRLDFLASDSTGTLPDFMERRSTPGFNDKCFGYLRDTDHVILIMPEAAGLPSKQLFKRVRFELFHLDLEPPEKEGDTSALLTYPGIKQGDVTVRYNSMSNNVFVSNYMSKDKVTSRYPFHKAEI